MLFSTEYKPLKTLDKVYSIRYPLLKDKIVISIEYDIEKEKIRRENLIANGFKEDSVDTSNYEI